MNLETIYGVLTTLSTLLVGGLAIYFKVSTKAQAKAKEIQEVTSQIIANAVIFIKEAEDKYKDTTNAGGIKFNEVVTKLYDLVPDPIKGIITKDMIGEIVQSTFDEIEEYVKLQLDAVIDKTNEGDKTDVQ